MDVYWSPYVLPEEYEYHQKAYFEPEPLMQSLTPMRNPDADPKNSWFACPAAKASINNTFIIRNPHHLNFNFNEDGTSYYPNGTDTTGWAKTRTAALTGALTIDITMSVVLFSSESLEATTTPPYMHAPENSLYGHYVPGTYDIGSWLRPIDFSFQLWPGVRSYVAAQGEPMLYVKFHTKEKVNLVRFDLTREIYDIGSHCVGYKQENPKTPLAELYKGFEEHRAFTLDLIKKASRKLT
jgi:hypothetical protein